MREQPLNDAEIMEILEYGVPSMYRKEFTVQGFDPLTQGLKKFIDFCSRLESCELTMENPIPKKLSSTDETVVPKKKRKRAKSEKQFSRIRKQYCELHGENPSHSTSECFELNHRKKRARGLLELTTPQGSKKQRKIPYKDLNAFINPKVKRAFKKRAKRRRKLKKSHSTPLNASKT